MSKKKNIPAKEVPQLKKLTPVAWYENTLYAQLVLALIAFALYFNSIFNGYALDDIISITGNAYTKKGLAGIPDILSKDSMVGFIGSASELSGGRWRPLALISFAIEWELFPDSPHISHFINVLIYTGIAVFLFRFLHQHIFKNNVPAAFIAVMLFVIHPVHTEVVANIKSRDELLSMLLLLMTILFALNYYYRSHNLFHLILSFVCYFLALLSKENGLTFIAILPLIFYITSADSIKKVLLKAVPFAVIAVLYMLLRVTVISYVHKEITEVMNAPFLYATPMQALATKIYILLLYIKLLLYPYPLNYDYSYNQIPYVDFSNIGTIISILVYGSLLVYAVINILKKDILAFGILFYLLSIFIVSNLVVDIGGTMGERFLFQPSVGFAIAITSLAVKATLSLSASNKIYIAIPVLLVLLVVAGTETILRNNVWKTENRLFMTDVRTCPNSARTNNGAGTSYILESDLVKDTVKRNLMLDTAEYLLKRALIIHPKYIDPLLNLGVVYNRRGDVYKAAAVWNKVRSTEPHHPKLAEFDKILATMFLNRGNEIARTNFLDAARIYMQAARYNPDNPDIWYNAGGAYFMAGKFDSSQMALTKCLQLKPDYPKAADGLRDAMKMTGKYQ